MKYSIAILSLLALPAYADVDITGNVEAKCVIQTTKSGVYGNPIASKLSTTPADGGVLPVIRFDVALADYYTANITHPTFYISIAKKKLFNNIFIHVFYYRTCFCSMLFAAAGGKFSNKYTYCSNYRERVSKSWLV